jgi:hypothetical protein
MCRCRCGWSLSTGERTGTSLRHPEVTMGAPLLPGPQRVNRSHRPHVQQVCGQSRTSTPSWHSSCRCAPRRAPSVPGRRRLTSRISCSMSGWRSAPWQARRSPCSARRAAARTQSDRTPGRSTSGDRRDRRRTPCVRRGTGWVRVDPLRAVRRRLVDPTAVAGLDEIADHGLTVDRGDDSSSSAG